METCGNRSLIAIFFHTRTYREFVLDIRCKFFLWIVLIFVSLLSMLSCGRDIERLDRYGPIHVGGLVPQYAGMSLNGREFGPTTPVGNFFIHLIGHDLPAACLDSECGDEGRLVEDQGGHFIGSSDGKLAKLFGVNIVQTTPHRFDVSLIVVSNEKGIITSIYKNGHLKHIRILVKEIGIK